MKQRISVAAVAVATAVATIGCGEESAEDGDGECPARQTSCDSRCVDLQSNSLHCGHCGGECPVGSTCMNGSCVCQAGLNACGQTCMDLQTDGAHCGGCDQPCPAGQVCSGATCMASCPPGVTQCGTSCVDTNTHLLHCGGCNLACPAGQACSGGTCGCPEGLLLCAGSCVDPQTDASNCGSCGNRCTGGAACSAGTCGGSSGTTCSTTEEELFSFFLISLEAVQRESGSADGFGGDLGGLSGADAICQRVAEYVSPCQVNKSWVAFLSTSTVNAIDRIGQGPWHDRQGRLLANEISELLNDRPIHADPLIIDDLPNEYGIPNWNPDGTGDVDNHEILTGSGTDGRLYNQSGGGGFDMDSTCGDNEQWTADKATCWDWTSSQPEGCPRVGHSWPALSGENWISVWNEGGCAPGGVLVSDGPSGDGPDGTRRVGSAGGYGGWYCFAVRP
jgi:hypothetical protein